MDWPELKTFRAKIPHLKADLLPVEIGDYLVDASSRMGIPLESIAASSLVGLSSLLGRKIGIYPNANSTDWQEYANLWGVIVGRPSFKKSSTVEQAIGPLLSWEKQKNDQYLKAKKYVEEKVERLTEAIEDLKLSKEEDDRIDQRIKLKKLRFWKKWRKHLQGKKYVANDATYAALLKILEKNPDGLFVFRDEIGGWFRQLKRPDRASERYLYLEGWRGKTSRSNQTDKNTIFLPAVCLSVLGATHPATMQAYIGDMEGGIFNDGLINRFSMIIYPDSDFIPRKKDQADAKAFESYLKVFEYFKSLKITDGGLHFSPDAQKLFDDWEESLQRKFHESRNFPLLMEFHLSKYPKTFCALALIFEKIFEYRDQVASREISLESCQLAKKWCDYLEIHARKLFGLEDYKTTPAVKEIIKRIEMGHICSGMTVREIQRIRTPVLDKADTIKKALNQLEKKHWLRVHYQGRQGKVELNPRIATH